MNALFYLFWRKNASHLRTAILYTGYDPTKRDLTERLYGLYLILMFSGWLVVMLAWFVTTFGGVLQKLNVRPDEIEQLLFYGLSLWIIIIPALAFRSFDVYGFELGDLPFLANAPFGPALVASVWFIRSLFHLFCAIFVLAGALLGSATSFIAGGNDWLGLFLGGVGAAFFLVFAWALRWLFGLNRYRPGHQASSLVAYGLPVVGLALLLVLPRLQESLGTGTPPLVRLLYWPAWFCSWLIGGPASGTSEILAATGILFLTALLAVLGIPWLARKTTLTPALEDGKLGGQYRAVVKLGGPAASEARLQAHLSRQFAASQGQEHIPDIRQSQMIGVLGALFFKQLARLKRLPLTEKLLTTLALIGAGSGSAVTLAVLSQNGAALTAAALPLFLANMALVRIGTSGVRRDLARLEFFAGWPTTLARLLSYNISLGLVVPLASGLVALGVAGLFSLNWQVITVWFLLWPLLLACTGFISLLEFQRQMRKWPATPDTVPEIGVLTLLVAWLVWIITVLFGPIWGAVTASLILFVYTIITGLSTA